MCGILYFQLKTEILELLSTRCPRALTAPDPKSRKVFNDYESAATHHVDEIIPFCGFKSLKNPTDIYLERNTKYQPSLDTYKIVSKTSEIRYTHDSSLHIKYEIKDGQLTILLIFSFRMTL